MVGYTGPDTDLAPDPAQIIAFCEWWFERCTTGVIEIGWLDARGRGLVNFEQYELNDMTTLAASAVQANLVPGQALYVRASTVKRRASFSRETGYTTDADFAQAPGIWSDIDTQEDFDHAKTVQTMVRPNAQVITGTVPHTRVQSWFRASEPIPSATLVRELNVRLHRLYGGDPAVINPTRLMRLPGTIAWPYKPGRVAELTRFVRPLVEEARPASYPVSLLTSQLPVLDSTPTPPAAPAAPRLTGGLTTVSSLIAAIKRGDQWHNSMVQLVAHWVGQGRSTTEILGHCADWTLPGYTLEDTRREVAKAIEGARVKWHRPDDDPIVSGASAGRHRILSLIDLDGLPPPTWLIHGLIPERSLVVPYGPPKAGKTFIVLSAGLHIAAGKDWFGHPVKQGAVVYIAGEGVGGLVHRLRAMRQKYNITATSPFWTIPRAVNLRVAAEVNALESLIRETIGAQPLRLLVVDTLARAMPGADENSAQEVGLVIAAADYLKDAFGCTVALVHHEGKDGTRGARGTSALRGAWDAAFQITGDGKRVQLTVVDQKDAETGQSLSFHMEEVQVSLGRTSLVPMLDENGETPVNDERREISGHAGLVLRTLRDALAGPESGILPPLGGLPDGDVRGVTVDVIRRMVYEKMPSISADARKKAFVRAVQILIQKQFIGVKDPWVWIV